jgi:hypothetical protein
MAEPTRDADLAFHDAHFFRQHAATYEVKSPEFLLRDGASASRIEIVEAGYTFKNNVLSTGTIVTIRGTIGGRV